MKSLLHSIFINNNITYYTIVYSIILLSLLFIIIFYVFETLKKYKFFQELDKVCFSKCDKDICKEFTYKTRGSQYYLNTDINENNAYNCLFTIWEASHIITHIFIGYYLDFRYSLLIGIPFEIYENRKYNCENYMDIFYNSMGAIIGGYLRYYK